MVTVAVPHDAPTAAELLESVREWLDRDVIPSTEGRLRFHARVAANVLGMVEREFVLIKYQDLDHRKRLERLGVADDVELAAAIRSGEFVDRAVELRAALTESVLDKLAVANPSYVNSD